MKVLALQSEDLVISGLIASMATCGFQSLYLTQDKCFFDALYEFRPDIVLCLDGQDTEEIKDGCKRYNCKLVSVGKNSFNPLPAANIAQLVGIYDEKINSEMSYIMVENPNPQTLAHLEKFTYPNFNKFLKIFGNTVPYMGYIGRISSLSQIGNILASSQFLLDYLNNFVMDAWMNRCVCIPYRSNPVNFLEEVFGRYEQPEELESKLHNYNNDHYRNVAIDTARAYILEEHTYFHRCHDMLNNLGFTEEGKQCLSTLSELIKLPKLA